MTEPPTLATSIIDSLTTPAFPWDDDTKQLAVYAIAAVSLLIGAKESGGGAKADATLRFKLAEPAHVEAFNRLIGDFLCGPIKGRPNVVEVAQARAAEIETLRKVLRSIEWAGRSVHFDMPICPSCLAFQPIHEKGCALKAAI